jgi:hypothetical protein
MNIHEAIITTGYSLLVNNSWVYVMLSWHQASQFGYQKTNHECCHHSLSNCCNRHFIFVARHIWPYWHDFLIKWTLLQVGAETISKLLGGSSAKFCRGLSALFRSIPPYIRYERLHNFVYRNLAATYNILCTSVGELTLLKVMSIRPT